MERKKNIAVEFLKFFAVFLVINSHADIMYVRYGALATGGAIGDCLFLFVSGFTLFQSQPRRFDNYYKRRILRIFPSVIASLMFIRIVHPNKVFSPLEMAGGEFIVALMIYYVMLYYVRRYAINHIPKVLAGWAVLTIVVYVFFFPYKYETGEFGLYGITTYFRWIPFFMFMLTGAWMGWLKSSGRDNYKSLAIRDFALMVLSLALFYGIQFTAKLVPAFAPWQIVSLLPLMGVIYFMYRWCEAPVFGRLYARRKCARVVSCIAGLCLESYLIQFAIISDKLNCLWPANLLIMACVILFCAYVVRCGARFISQTFSPSDYDWREVFRL